MQILVIVLGVVLIVVGLTFAIRGVGADPAGGGASGVTLQGPAWLLLVALGVGLVVLGVSREPNGESGTADPDPTTTTTRAPGSVATGDPQTTTTSSTLPASTASTDDGSCRITTSNPLVVIHEEPDVFAQEIIQVPTGTYQVEDVRTVPFGPERQRWLRITASGRTGWLEDSTFNISSKSAACP